MDTHISNLLGTNTVPSGAQSYEIIQTISKKSVDRTRLDLDIERARTLLEDLTLQRNKVQTEIDAYEALLTPARRLIPELLGEIFLHCLPATDHLDIFHPFYLQPPILFTRVCSTWRKVALSSPRLWCSIFSYISRGKTPVVGAIVDPTAETWLSLSRNCPLSFALHGSGDLDPHQDWENMADVFLRHSSRWKHVTLRQPDRSLSIFRVTDEGTPWLESIDITATRWKKHDDEGMQSLAIVLRTSPRLRSLSWSSGWLELHSSLLAIPWGQLTRVNLDCRISLEDFVEIFPQLTRTESCSLRRVWGEIPPSHSPHYSVSLLRMHTFHLSSAGNLALILMNITLPAIVDLVIDHFNSSREDSPSSWSLPIYMSLLPPSSCRLRRLALHMQTHISEGDIIQCLRITSATLVELTLTGDVDVTDRVLRALTPVQRADYVELGLCPNLGIIELLGCVHSSDGCLADMIESRWKSKVEWETYIESYPGLSRLRYVSLRMYSSQTSGHSMDIQRLNDLVDEGLDGQIEHYVT